MSSRRALLLLLAACLLGAGARAQEPRQHPLERRARKVMRHLGPGERRNFEALAEKTGGDPRALEVVVALHEHILNLRDLREQPSGLPPDEHRARRRELLRGLDELLEPLEPGPRERLLDMIGAELRDVGYAPRPLAQATPRVPAPEAGKGPSPPPSRRGPPPPLVLLVLASPFVALYLLRKRIAAWIVRQGLGGAPVPAPATPPSPSTVTPSGSSGRIPTGYRLIRQIGSGGMGAVYEAEDVSLERRVAIKRMREEIRQDPRELERFLKEARTVAKLRHPNIIEIHNIVELDGEIYLVFEFIDGSTLDQRLARQGRMSTARAGATLGQVCAALSYAHDRGVVHRDLKPSNIMVTREEVVKVMDFGVARQAKDVLNRLSMTNTVAGTPPYMAPESETGVVRLESDLYSLGVCAYEMLTGTRPFDGTGAGMLLAKQAMEFEPPSRRVDGLPPAVDAFFRSAMHADPERRPRSAGEFAAAFDGASGARG